MLSPHHENIVAVILHKPDHYRALAVALQAGYCLTDVKGRADPGAATASAIRDARLVHLLNLRPGEPAHDTRSVRDVLPRPVAHAVAASACCRIWLISAARRPALRAVL